MTFASRYGPWAIVAGASEGGTPICVAGGEVGHVGAAEDDGSGGAEAGDERGILRRDAGGAQASAGFAAEAGYVDGAFDADGDAVQGAEWG